MPAMLSPGHLDGIAPWGARGAATCFQDKAEPFGGAACERRPGTIRRRRGLFGSGPTGEAGRALPARGIIPGCFRYRLDKSMNLLDFFVAPVFAQAAPAQPGMGGFGLLMPIALIAIMYFLMIRPQMKRAKEHRAMLDKLSKGDEVITSGGIAGTVTDIGDNFVTVEVADNVRLRVQKGAVGNVLPKGTLKSA